MNPIQGIPKVKDQVMVMLERYTDLRDSDSRLIANLWYLQAQEKGVTITKEVIGFLNLVSTGELTSPETIRRARQLLQETHPELQGEKYEPRHHEAKEVKTSIPQIKEMVC